MRRLRARQRTATHTRRAMMAASSSRPAKLVPRRAAAAAAAFSARPTGWPPSSMLPAAGPVRSAAMWGCRAWPTGQRRAWLRGWCRRASSPPPLLWHVTSCPLGPPRRLWPCFCRGALGGCALALTRIGGTLLSQPPLLRSCRSVVVEGLRRWAHISAHRPCHLRMHGPAASCTAWGWPPSGVLAARPCNTPKQQQCSRGLLVFPGAAVHRLQGDSAPLPFLTAFPTRVRPMPHPVLARLRTPVCPAALPPACWPLSSSCARASVLAAAPLRMAAGARCLRLSHNLGQRGAGAAAARGRTAHARCQTPLTRSPPCRLIHLASSSRVCLVPPAGSAHGGLLCSCAPY
jgi:hypothetical protein